MNVEIKIIEEHSDEEKFAASVAKTMSEMNTDNVKYAVTHGPRGYLYSAMILKIS
jgi:hypothetical protein